MTGCTGFRITRSRFIPMSEILIIGLVSLIDVSEIEWNACQFGNIFGDQGVSLFKATFLAKGFRTLDQLERVALDADTLKRRTFRNLERLRKKSGEV